MIDIALVLEELVPSAQYGGSVSNDYCQRVGSQEQVYNLIRWEDDRTKPTWQQIQTKWTELNS